MSQGNNKDTRMMSMMSLLLVLNRFHSLVWFSVVEFEQVNANWEYINIQDILL